MPVASKSPPLATTLAVTASMLLALSIQGCAWMRAKQADDAEAAAARSQESAARAEEAANKAMESSAEAMKAADRAAAAVKEATKEMDRVSEHLEQMEREREAEDTDDEESDAALPHTSVKPTDHKDTSIGGPATKASPVP